MKPQTDKLTFLVRKAILGDLPEMIRLERICPAAGHWTEQQYGDLFAEQVSTRLALIAQGAEVVEPAGFLIARHLPYEWELENIVVAAECRRNGVATQLMQAFLAQAKQMNGELVFLEVRESNTAARTLYEKLEFRQTGRRMSNYSTTIEDDVLSPHDLLAGHFRG